MDAGYFGMPTPAEEKIKQAIEDAQMGEVIQEIIFHSEEPRIIDWAEGRPVDFALEAEIDEIRRLNGFPPRYGYRGKPGVLRSGEGGVVPTAVTPKIYSGGGGSNRDPPTAGAAAVQRVRETAEAERRRREGLLIAAR